MNRRYLASVGVLAIVSFVPLVAADRASSSAAATKTKAKATKPWTPPRTPDGQPDLQGTWDFRTITPLERPSELAGKDVLTDEEAAEFEKVTNQRRNQDRRDNEERGLVNGAPATADVERAYNQFWWDFGNKVVGTKRTSLIVDPADGKIPAMTPEGKKKQDERAAARQRPAVGPEDRGVGERCILGFNSGPPMMPSAYNNNVQIFQTRDSVAILNEMVHNARIVPIDGRAHGTIRQWVGDSRGHWEGDTLVIDTVNFRGETAFRGSGPNLHLTERFRRVDADTLVYEFTVNDPSTWTRPWTVQVPMTKSDGPIYEYACHEGNYGMFGILAAARAVEKQIAEETAKKSSK